MNWLLKNKTSFYVRMLFIFIGLFVLQISTIAAPKNLIIPEQSYHTGTSETYTHNEIESPVWVKDSHSGRVSWVISKSEVGSECKDLRSIDRSAAKTSTSLVTKYPANAAISGTTQRVFLRPGQVIDRYGSLGGKWFSKPGVSYGARSIPPRQAPYMQFKVLKPFEVNRSLASPGMLNGQTGFGVQFQSPVGADILIKRGIIAPF